MTPDSAAKRLLKFSAMAVVMAVGKKDVVWQYVITNPILRTAPWDREGYYLLRNNTSLHQCEFAHGRPSSGIRQEGFH